MLLSQVATMLILNHSLNHSAASEHFVISITPQSPNILLSLYNDVVEHAAMVCTSGALGQMSWPAPDFDASAPAGKSMSNSCT